MGDAIDQEVVGVGGLHHSGKAGNDAAQQQSLSSGLAALVQGVDEGAAAGQAILRLDIGGQHDQCEDKTSQQRGGQNISDVEEHHDQDQRQQSHTKGGYLRLGSTGSKATLPGSNTSPRSAASVDGGEPDRSRRQSARWPRR